MNEIQITKSWIKNMVLAQNLCPFAHKVWQDDQIDYILNVETNVDQILKDILVHGQQLMDADSTQISTSIIILPFLDSSFEDYLDVYYSVESYIEELEWKNYLQLASFHPAYQFADVDFDDVGNYTNRSPHALIQLLRVEEVAKARQHFLNIDNIPSLNKQKMTELGEQEILRKLAQIQNNEL